MPDTATLSQYLKPEHVTDGDTITFTDAGEIKDKEFEEKGEKTIRRKLEIGVTFRGEAKTYSPNANSVKLLSAAWGTNTEAWIGKTATLTVVPMNNGKDGILAKPAKEKVA